MAASRSRSAPATTSLPQRLGRRLRRYNWRPAAWLAAGSLGFSLVLVGYLFGADHHFLGRLFSAFVVVFGLLAFTLRVAVPFVGWAAANWFGSAWADAPQPVRSPRRTSAAVRADSPIPSRRASVPARHPRNPELYP